MKLLQDLSDAKTKSKILKPQVERRRRERINRSLDTLKSLLLQRQEETQRRVEKAEILEHTVLFLQNTAKEDKTRAGGGSLQEGFSTCLQRAAQFLGPEGKGLWLRAALESSFAAHFSTSDSDSPCAQRKTEAYSTSSSLPHTNFILWMLRQKFKRRQHSQASGLDNCVHTYQLQVQQEFHQEHQKQHELEIRTESHVSKQSPSHSCPANQALWRPWP